MSDKAEIFFDEIIHETEPGDEQHGAYLFQIDDEQVWLPKSLVEIPERGVMEIPQWLAEERDIYQLR